MEKKIKKLRKDGYKFKNMSLGRDFYAMMKQYEEESSDTSDSCDNDYKIDQLYDSEKHKTGELTADVIDIQKKRIRRQKREEMKHRQA